MKSLEEKERASRLLKISSNKFIIKFGSNRTRALIKANYGKNGGSEGYINLPNRVNLPKDLIGKRVNVILEILE